jgi:flavoprotein
MPGGIIYFVPAEGSKISVPEGQLDKAQHCYTCFDMNCRICKGKIFIETDELEYVICQGCPKIQCEVCSDIIKHSERQ